MSAPRTPLDRLLRMGLIEARSYERFDLLSREAQGELGDGTGRVTRWAPIIPAGLR